MSRTVALVVVALGGCILALPGAAVRGEDGKPGSEQRAFFEEHKDAVEQLKSADIPVKDARDAFIANRALCSSMAQRVTPLEGSLQELSCRTR